MQKRLFLVLIFSALSFLTKAQGSCNAFFIYNIQNGNTVQFFNSSTVGLPITWNFGDGNTDNSYSPGPHWYQSTGTYIVCVTVGDSSCSATYCDTIQILHTPCTANFVFYPNGNLVHVENQSTPLYPMYGSVWSYGDGFSDTTTFPPSHLYTNPGTYVVCLTIHDSACISTQCDTIVVSTDSCHAAFQTFQQDNHLLFLNNSQKPSNAFCYWEFGDGQSSSHCDSVTHVYQATGSYLVCLTVYDSLCQNTFCDTIHVNLVNGINSLQNTSYSAIPNPFMDELNFKTTVLNYSILGMDGRIILEGLNTSKINTQTLQSGMYLLQFTMKDGQIIHQKIVKE